MPCVEFKEFKFLPLDQNSNTREVTGIWGWSLYTPESLPLMKQVCSNSVKVNIDDCYGKTYLSLSFSSYGPCFACRVSSTSSKGIAIELTSVGDNVKRPVGTFRSTGLLGWTANIPIDQSVIEACTTTRGTRSLNVKFEFKLTLELLKPTAPVEHLIVPQLAPKLTHRRLYDEKVSDAILVVRASTDTLVDIPVSKAVLSDTSEVFYKMFSAGFAESESPVPRINMGDFSEASVRAMVEFIYTNSITTVLDNVELRKQLYDLSERYEIDMMATVAANMIVKEDLQLVNVIKLLGFSEK
ncbi:hypothetical protein SeMB42_g07930 [Synchytrium endobioticum]|uniref:BTB domain-containing protein n=1 Tax=Synchytrium endobioticum TaxID=286115 RepID=A0A507BHK2_9FUNG|nr:hypothetical protein SeMB42_g07930 [Synchytrium endobioticum]